MNLRRKVLLIIGATLLGLLLLLYLAFDLVMFTGSGYLLPVLLFVGFAYTLGIIILVDRTMLKRLSALSEIVRNVTSTGDLHLRVPDTGRDQLSLLGEAINKMLSALESSQARLRYLSLHDAQTGLFNRMYFEQRLHELRAGKVFPVGMILCDIDGLKLVNDTLGHAKGDCLLVSAARLIKESIDGHADVARIGGDEFAVLMAGASEGSVEDKCSRIGEALKAYNQTHPELPLSISVGYAVSDQPGKDPDELFMEADNRVYREKLQRGQSPRSAIVRALMNALQARDFSAEGHADRLQELSAALGNAINLPEQRILDLRLLARFHDIGKVGIPDRILFKPGPLTAEEDAEMRRHCEIGYRIALSAPDLAHIADWILKHHEWWNGGGYPLGLSGYDIPLECRILAIADAYDAITSDRPYRAALPQEKAVAELRKCAGRIFDPGLVDVFIKCLTPS